MNNELGIGFYTLLFGSRMCADGKEFKYGRKV